MSEEETKNSIPVEADFGNGRFTLPRWWWALGIAALPSLVTAFNSCTSSNAELERKLDKVVEAQAQQQKDFATFQESYRKDSQTQANDLTVLKVQQDNLRLKLETMRAGDK